MAEKKQIQAYNPVFKPAQELARLDIHLISGASHMFRRVRIFKDDQSFIRFFYLSAHDDTVTEGIFHKSAIAGFSWR